MAIYRLLQAFSPDHINRMTAAYEAALRPPCPKCGAPMWLMRLSAFDAHDLRTFKCQVCEHTESMAVKFR